MLRLTAFALPILLPLCALAQDAPDALPGTGFFLAGTTGPDHALGLRLAQRDRVADVAFDLSLTHLPDPQHPRPLRVELGATYTLPSADLRPFIALSDWAQTPPEGQTASRALTVGLDFSPAQFSALDGQIEAATSTSGETNLGLSLRLAF
ncbi:hypothetical protein [Tropicibacter naphthalenivorans]|uniref:Uncharacterized protein n=1 Tax=Tropicibacter naphthalenivorans TaxID=441103 RepID=A0A0N7LYM0_9RHOB|nr:hypothetical protein [Tropicibacter naphthalenivorans]CUH75241.1 hypothetical protein TRN7648_00339 [Tropicibacter naphthalenivorans]SMC45412.1 hypothetical protein SAMN04488093_101541 [Tropicibacter naphthalenivorans]